MKVTRIFLFVMAFLLTLLTFLYGQTITETKDLLAKLFTADGYDKRIRPEQDMVDVTRVTISLLLNSIIELDEVEEKLVTTASLHLSWFDTNLVWNSADYGGTDILFLPQDNIWKPDVVLLNSVKDYKELGGDNLQVEVHDDGQVNWYPIQIILSGGEDDIILDDYSENSAWTVEATSWNIELDSGEASISFNIDLRRKPLFVLFTTIVPIVMLSFLNTLVFALPNESGEKASYAVTVFLALAVFLTIISSTLPENSDSISLFSIYVTAQTVQSTLITAMTLLMIRLSGLEDSNLIPRWLVKLTLLFQRLRSRKNRVRDSQLRKNRVRDSQTNLMHEDKNTKVIEKKEAPGSISDVSTNHHTPNSDVVSWKEAMATLDILSYVFFTLTSFLITLVCLLMAQYGS